MGKRGFLRWIQIINPAILRHDLRELFEEYQVAVFDYLYQGSEARNTQLEDIRTYAVNINNGIHIKNHIMEYVGEQKNHRDLCLASTPEQWLQMRNTITQTKSIPSEAEKLKAINTLPTGVIELKDLKKKLQTVIWKQENRLKYQTESVKAKENPMPEGYNRERTKLLIADNINKIDRINDVLLKFHEVGLGLEGRTHNQQEG